MIYHFASTSLLWFPRSHVTIALVVVVPNNLCEWHLEGGGISWNPNPSVGISWLVGRLVDPFGCLVGKEMFGCFITVCFFSLIVFFWE